MKRAVLLLTVFTGCGPGPSLVVPVPFAVVHTSPAHGAIDVGTDVQPIVGFNRSVDEVSAEDVVLQELNDEGRFEDRAVERVFDDASRSVILVPGAPLAAGIRHRILVPGSVSAIDGTALEAPLRAEFKTAP
jgi:hypothetical protein